ncbi:hypothetical protein Glove_349g162 [Diversispora epigaea]|uniref:Uncharacterized protein n=1 Tax=Diversispora epigaea TaxID=1348612 RepID=A0A397HI40_9GLOM|nr:hypothetical protein Glove_349g162 [Diversispora epigaea]
MLKSHNYLPVKFTYGIRALMCLNQFWYLYPRINYMSEIDSPFTIYHDYHSLISYALSIDMIHSKPKKQIAYTSLSISSKSATIWHEQTKCSELAGYRQIEDNFELGLRNRAFLSELDSKELKDNELERLTMFSIVDNLDSVPLHTKTTPLSFKHKAITLKSWVEIVNKLHSRIVHFRNLTCQLCGIKN